jgi:Protein of unknown function (DUF4238)
MQGIGAKMLSSEMKRRHHYVWKYYLGAWANDGKIVCFRNNNIFETNLVNIGVKKNFYRLQELNHKDIELINKLFIEPSPVVLQDSHRELVEMFNFPFEIKRLSESEGLDSPQLRESIEKTISNLEEDYHAGIESTAIKYIDAIRAGDINFHTSPNSLVEFLHFLTIQYMRTNKIKSSIRTGVTIINIEKIWNIVSHILAMNSAYTLSLEIDNHAFQLVSLTNISNVPFITGDQPVINTYGNYEVMPEKLELYYPISPTKAILITENKKYRATEKLSYIFLDDKEVTEFNGHIAKKAHEQLYASSRKDLEDCIKR